MEAHDAGFQTEVLVVVLAQLLGEELLPAVACLGVGRVRVFFFEGSEIGNVLFIPRINARRRGKEVALHAVDAGGVEHVRVDEDVVVRDVSELRGYIADTAHVGGKVVHLMDAAGGLQSVMPEAQVEQLEFVGRGGLKFGLFDIDAAHPIALCLEALHEMMADETSGSGD